jgi:hypothetical protein
LPGRLNSWSRLERDTTVTLTGGGGERVPVRLSLGASPLTGKTVAVLLGRSLDSSAMSSNKPSDPGVLGSLPSTRPSRLGRPRDGAGGTATRERPEPKAQPRARTAPRTKAAPKKKAATRRAPAKATGPRAVRSAAPALERKPGESRREPPPPPQPSGPPRGAELVTTAVKATGELAQIGVTVGGQMLKRAVRRFPRVGRD